MNEMQIINQIGDYFINLGYKEAMFEREASLSSKGSRTMRADFVVSINKDPYIVVEAKIGRTFEKINVDELKYDPSVRQVQKYAMQIKAPFYVITNGKVYLWFKTDEDGRPLKIDPISYEANTEDNNNIDYPIERVLSTCMDILRSGIKNSDCMYELILILLARIAVDFKLDYYSNNYSYNLKYEIQDILRNEYNMYQFDTVLDRYIEDETLIRCWSILSDFDLERVPSNKFISALYNIVPRYYHYPHRLSDKLAEFMIKLAQIDDYQNILDPVSNLGEITSNITDNSNIYSYCQSREQYVFLILQNRILGKNTNNVRLISFDDYILNGSNNNDYTSFDRIITALPFGMKIRSHDYRYKMYIDSTNVEDYLLASSIELLKENGRLVAIVPDSMLFAGGKREHFRRYLLERYCIRSVISLPVGSLSNTGVKASIIVIDKSLQFSGQVFFGIINNENISQNRLFVDKDGNSIGLLKSYEDFILYNRLENGESYKSALVDYDVDNLRAETFLLISDSLRESKYPLYTLKDVCLSLIRGTAIKNEANGDIAFIGPAAIRANKLDTENLSFTSDTKITRPLVYAQSGDVVMNNISSQLGSSTIIKLDNPIAVNQHVILLKADSQKIIPEYLSIVLNNQDVNKSILLSATGTTIPSITIKNLREIKIPVPDLEEQRQIIDVVNRLQEELNQIEEVKNNLQNKLVTVVNTLSFGEVQ